MWPDHFSIYLVCGRQNQQSPQHPQQHLYSMSTTSAQHYHHFNNRGGPYLFLIIKLFFHLEMCLGCKNIYWKKSLCPCCDVCIQFCQQFAHNMCRGTASHISVDLQRQQRVHISYILQTGWLGFLIGREGSIYLILLCYLMGGRNEWRNS